MTDNKKFIPCIYICEDKAWSDFTKTDVISEDPAALAEAYSDAGADELIVFDLSPEGNDKLHEDSLHMLQKICKAVDVDVLGAGNVKRMEDIKKLLYAGCKKAFLNYSKEGNREILKEVSDKFGKDKIGICYSNPQDITNDIENVDNLASELIFIGENGKFMTNSLLPVVLYVVSGDDNGLIENLKSEKIQGVTGTYVNANYGRINEWKDVCKSEGIPVFRLEAAFSWDQLKKNSEGMVPVIVQDYRTDQVLMLAYMNEEAYNTTIKTGKMTYFSRSRNELWIKGETSSHYQYVKSIYTDCDYDTILAKVKQIGAACHTGKYSCFFNEIASRNYTEKNPQKVLDSVFDVIKDRKVNPREGSYTNYLFDKGVDKILKKLGEEATEIVIASKNPEEKEIVYEISDFLYHMMVLMAEKNVSWEDVTDELSRR